MNHTVRFEPEADAEYQESIAHFEGAQTGLGERFRSEVEKTLRKVCDDPKRFRRVRGDVRKASVPVFDYSIYFTIEDDEIAVAAVFHPSRNPETLQDRGLI